MSRILITGGTGCIGATTVHHLLKDVSVTEICIVSRSAQTHLLQLWQRESLDPRMSFISANVADSAQMAVALTEFMPTHIVHLGALQSPACAAEPHRGLEVNLAGTLNLLEIVTAHVPGLERFVFASSAAVYGQRDHYVESVIPESVPLAPPNLYGIWKLAGEHLARLFHAQTGISTVCLRLNTTYGPGRDLGLTSAVTTAMKNVVNGAHRGTTQPFVMPYDGRENYHYVEDVGAHFAGCTLSPFSGFAAFNIKGQTVLVADFLQHIRDVAEEEELSEFCDLSISENADPNLFVCDLDDTAVDSAFPGLPRTPIPEGIRRSFEILGRANENSRG